MRTTLFLIFLFLPILIYARDDRRDPFETILPRRGVEPIEKEEDVEAVSEEFSPLELTIEGVLWGTELPLAIIDGEVYRIGDTLKDVDAKVYKIEKNNVFILYWGSIYKMGVRKKEER